MSEYNSNTILITGINGFIGRHLCNYLANTLRCKNVYGIDKVPTSTQHLPSDRVIYTEIENAEEVSKVLKELRPQIIFHLAANINHSKDISDLNSMLQTNVIGTVNLLTAVQENGLALNSFINLGSCEEYGNCSQLFKEQQVPDPVSIYSGTKAASTVLSRMFFNLYGIPVTTARPSLVYGPGQNERFFIIEAVKKLLAHKNFDMTEGNQTRDFLFVRDLVSALVELSKTPKLAGETVNISSGKEYRLKDIILKIAELTESRSEINIGAIPYRQNEIMRYACDNSKITSLTDWKPVIDINEGLQSVIEYIGSSKTS